MKNTFEEKNFKKMIKTGLCLFLTLVMLASSTAVLPLESYAAAKQQQNIEKRVETILKSMTLKEKVAQMLILHLPKEPTKTQKKYQYGGYLLFATHFEKRNKSSIKKIFKRYQSVSKIKMFISVDEEGGSVVRVSKFKQYRSKPFKSPRGVYAAGGKKGLLNDAKKKAAFLKALGINTNFAPVADVPYNSNNFIYSRSFSTKAGSTAKFVQLTVKGMNQKKCVSSLKHFPGYGNNGDTHTNVIVDKRSKKTFTSRDLKPFQAGIKAGAPMIMVSHNIVRCFDKKHPASMSANVHKYLRKNMGFNGIIITDSLGMAGVRNKYRSDSKVAVQAVLAGNDMLCTPFGKTSVKAITAAVKSGKIKRSQIDDSVRRILRVKLKNGIIK